MSDDYSDIINNPHHVSQSRPHLPRSSRAAQFASFAALTGYEDAIDETARLTDEKADLCEEKAAELNEKIRLLGEHIAEEPYCEVTYFIADKHKSGGSLVTVSGKVRFIEEATEQLVFCGGLRVPLGDIVGISLIKEQTALPLPNGIRLF